MAAQSALLAPENRRRVLLVVALVLLLAVFLRYGYQAVAGYNSSLEDAIALQEAKLERLSRIIANKDDYSDLHRSLVSFREALVREKFVKEGTPSLSEVTFQNLVRDLAQETRVDIRAIKILPRVERDSFSLLKMNINARAEIGAIRDFLVRIQDHQRYLFFDDLEIKIISTREKRYFYFNAQLSALTTT